MMTEVRRSCRMLAATALLLLLSWATAQIGRPLLQVVEAAELRLEPGPQAAPARALTERGAELLLEVRGSALYRVAGDDRFDDAGIADAARVIAAATGFFEAIEAPLVAYLRQNLPLLAGAGTVRVAVEGFRLELEVTGEAAPYLVRWEIALAEVPEEAFAPARHAKGAADARYVIREFSDLRCSFCARFAREVVPVLEARLLARGDVRLEFHHLPLAGPESASGRAAEATECVADANADDTEAFWRYLYALFEQQQAWGMLADPDRYFVRLAAEVGVSADGVAACLAEGVHTETVRASAERALLLGLNATPTVFVGSFQLADIRQLESYLEAMALIDAFAEDE